MLLEYEWSYAHCDMNSDQKISNLHIACTEMDFKHKFFTGRPSPRFNDAVTGGQPGGSSQNGGQPGGSSQTGGAIGIKSTGVSSVFIALIMLPFVIFVH